MGGRSGEGRMRRTVRQRSGRRKRAIREGGRQAGRGGKVRGQGETRVRAGNKGVEQEEERMGEEKGKGGCERQRWGSRGEERRGEGTGTDSQTVSLLFDMCCR